jgi:glycosyltransferase involved in cell wall biosynthesis
VGGLGKHVTELIPALGRAGVEVHLVTPRRAGGAPREAIAPVTFADGSTGESVVYRVEPPASDSASFYAMAERTNESLGALVRSLWDDVGPFDLIHVHDWLVGFAGESIKHAVKAPLLATIHATEYGRCRGHIANDMSRAINLAEWRLTYESWRVICCSRFMANEVGTALGTPPNKVDVIPNGVDTRRFDVLQGEDLREFRRGFARPDEAVIFYVGRVVHEKGVHLLVEAMPGILTQRPAKLVVAGTGDSLNAVRQLAFDRGVGANCYFTGFIPDATRDRLFRIADVAAFPSLYEPFGIVALEAMAAKAPVVASEVGGLAEVLRHAENAITVFPNRVDSLTWGILHTLQYPDWARQRAATAYRMVREEYNWDTIARQTLGVYRQIASERKLVVWR